MKTLNFLIKTVLIIGIVFTFYISKAVAQGASDGAPYGAPRGASGGAPYGGGGKGSSVPIDGGAALLLAAGAAYGIKKIREHRENGKDSSI